MSFSCPWCQASLLVAISDTATIVSCPHCAKPITVPASGRPAGLFDFSGEGLEEPTSCRPKPRTAGNSCSLGVLLLVIGIVGLLGDTGHYFFKKHLIDWQRAEVRKMEIREGWRGPPMLPHADEDNFMQHIVIGLACLGIMIPGAVLTRKANIGGRG